MATHSSVLAWRIPGMVEPGELPSMGSHRVGHNWSDLAAAAAVTVSAFILFNLFSYDFRVRCERITSKHSILWKCFNLKTLLHMWQFVPYILRKPLYLWLISCVPYKSIFIFLFFYPILSQYIQKPHVNNMVNK